MCTYCERRTDIKSGWEQPKLPYHGQKDASANLSGNALENEEWDGVIRDYQTACPKLILTCPGYFDGGRSRYNLHSYQILPGMWQKARTVA